MVDLISSVASAKSAIELAKGVKAAIDKIGDAQTKMQMAELLSTLADVKMDSAEKAEKIIELEKQLSLKEQTTYETPYYWVLSDAGEKDGPFCQRCHDAEQKMMRLHESKVDIGSWRCTECRLRYTDSSYVPKPKKKPAKSWGGATA